MKSIEEIYKELNKPVNKLIMLIKLVNEEKENEDDEQRTC